MSVTSFFVTMFPDLDPLTAATSASEMLLICSLILTMPSTRTSFVASRDENGEAVETLYRFLGFENDDNVFGERRVF